MALKTPKKHFLEFEPDFDFRLMGIVCTERSYRMGWLLNNSLTFALERVDDFVIELPRKREPGCFEFFEYQDTEQRLEYYLLGNRCDTMLLVPEMKQVDYWLIMKGLFENLDETGLMQGVKRIGSVQTAFMVDPETLKSKENLIF